MSENDNGGNGNGNGNGNGGNGNGNGNGNGGNGNGNGNGEDVGGSVTSSSLDQTADLNAQYSSEDAAEDTGATQEQAEQAWSDASAEENN